MRVRGAEELGVEARASISASQRGRVRGVWALRPWGELSRWPRSRTSISKWHGTFCRLLALIHDNGGCSEREVTSASVRMESMS